MFLYASLFLASFLQSTHS
ncbi:sortase B protein-sorting domain-containing protein [Listeria monocytogenes]|nr:sortase B protein-sorting domain-containing protein [Listeria monocytogenes]